MGNFKIILEDDSVSWAAKGLFAYLTTLDSIDLNKVPDDNEALMALNELKIKGYLQSDVKWKLVPEGGKSNG